MFDKCRRIIEVFKQKYWQDPVWSKVISYGITVFIGSAFTVLAVLAKSIYNQVSFITVASQFFDYLNSTTQINNLVILTSIIFLSIAFYNFTNVLAPINRAFFCNNLLFLISDKLPMVILEPKVK